ncbi:MAG: hypothetical protein NC200_07885, partial [Candidatus Gastranaerophilales bacterium]|nr:hypothetical protein [Candidatus Gastranaerophilales bacterium]
NKYKEILSSIYKNDTEIVNDYVSLAEQDFLHKIFIFKYAPDNKGRKKVPLNNAGCSKNLAYSFYGESFIKITGKSEDDVIDYAIHFFQITMFIILSELLANTLIAPIDNDSVIPSFKLNIDAFLNYINLAIVTGVTPVAEFEIPVNYGELLEELLQLESKEKWLKIKGVDKKQAIQITAGTNYFLESAFENEGYHKTVRKNNIALDTRRNAELRIMRGATPDSIRFRCYISGMRTISRILSLNADPEQKIYLSKLHEKGADLVGNIIGFYFRALLQQCRFKSVKLKKSHYTTYVNFVSDYKNRTGCIYNIPLKSLVAILLSKKKPEQREQLINKYFTKHDTWQKADIRADLAELDSLLLNNNNKSVLARLYNELRRYYGW